MEERPREWGSAGFELPPDEGWESKLEQAKEGAVPQDKPTTPKQATDPAGVATQTQATAPHVAVANPMPQQQLFEAGISEVELEKLSVDKAKEVIASTADDPHAQKEQLSQLKAEYQKVKFNKDAKVREAA